MRILADFIYARRRIWAIMDDLTQDLRVESENLQNSDGELLEELIANYPSPRVRKSLSILQKGLF
jgi:hypothetical protein